MTTTLQGPEGLKCYRVDSTRYSSYEGHRCAHSDSVLLITDIPHPESKEIVTSEIRTADESHLRKSQIAKNNAEIEEYRIKIKLMQQQIEIREKENADWSEKEAAAWNEMANAVWSENVGKKTESKAESKAEKKLFVICYESGYYSPDTYHDLVESESSAIVEQLIKEKLLERPAAVKRDKEDVWKAKVYPFSWAGVPGPYAFAPIVRLCTRAGEKRQLEKYESQRKAKLADEIAVQAEKLAKLQAKLV